METRSLKPGPDRALLSHCLVHQQAETGTSPAGPVCAQCKQLIYTHDQTEPLRSYWESQPGAYTLAREPIFIYVRQRGPVHIRSLRAEET